MRKIAVIFTSIVGILAFAVVPVFAHVIVHPSSVGVAAFQEFTMSVPAEKDTTVAIKLLIPDGLQMVIPNVKAGWTITEKKTGSGDSAIVTEIDWTGGSIPPGQRDDFLFQAQVPAKEATLQWKAYQIYSDGSVVAWDHAPSKDPTDDSAPPPYSTTKVVNDLTGSSANSTTMMAGASVTNADLASRMKWLMLMSGGALVLSVVAIGMQMMRKNK